MISSIFEPTTATLGCMVNIFIDRDNGTSWRIPIVPSGSANTLGAQSQQHPPDVSAASPQLPSEERHRVRSVFDALLLHGHDEDFEPEAIEEFQPTDAPPGSPEKIDVLRRRVELGLPLWNDRDRCNYMKLSQADRN